MNLLNLVAASMDKKEIKKRKRLIIIKLHFVNGVSYRSFRPPPPGKMPRINGIWVLLFHDRVLGCLSPDCDPSNDFSKREDALNKGIMDVFILDRIAIKVT